MDDRDRIEFEYSLETEVEIVAALGRLRFRYEKGDKRALFRALELTLRGRLVAPPWLAEALIAGVQPWLLGDVNELGEAFDVTWPEGKHFPDKDSKLERKCWEVYHAVNAAKATHKTIDYEKIAKELQLNETYVKAYYRFAKALAKPP